MNNESKKPWGIGVFLSVSLMAATLHAVTNMWYPSTSSTFTEWPTNWVALSSLNDPKEVPDTDKAKLDFVGDTNNFCAFWSSNTNYFFIRMRVAVSNVTSTTFRDSHFVYIDRVGFTNGSASAYMPDYAIVWDSKMNDTTKHGLELLTGTNKSAVTWGQLILSDLDDNSGSKTAPPDFNLTGDGYIRTIDEQPTVRLGFSTYIDFAVKWSFISAYTALRTNQLWRLQFGSLKESNDHAAPNMDIAGGFNTSSAITNSWSETINFMPAYTKPLPTKYMFF